MKVGVVSVSSGITGTRSNEAVVPDPTISIATKSDFEGWDLLLSSGENQAGFLQEFGRRVVSMHLVPLGVMPLLALPLKNLSLPQMLKSA